MTEKKISSMTVNEWRYLIVIIVVVEGFIAYSSFIHAGNANALSYISFAGTLVSIILAVLAIGYTYGESVKQKNNADTVVGQINKLNDVIDNIDLSVDALNRIETISNNLNLLSATFNQSVPRIDATHTGVYELKKYFQETISSYTNKEPYESSHKYIDNIGEIAKSIVSAKDGVTCITLLLVLLHKVTCGEQTNTLQFIGENTTKYQSKANDSVPSTDKLEINPHNLLLLGGVTSVYAILKQLKLINYTDKNKNQVLINEDLEQEIRDTLNKPKPHLGKLTLKTIELITEDILRAENSKPKEAK